MSSGQDSSGPTLKAKTESFLHEFFVKGEVLVRELIEENERLRVALRDRGNAAPPDQESATTAVPGVVERLMDRVDQLESECAEIRRMAGSVQQESGGYRARLEGLEREHYHLAAMYVAGNQFHAAQTIEDVLRTITEILLNFIGVGQFTIFCADEERQMLFPVAREGGEVSELEEMSLGREGPLAPLVECNAPWRPGDPFLGSEEALMHLPLVSGTRLVGVARIEQFLPQKHEFEDNDHSLLELVSAHAGIGVETAWIRAHAEEMPLRRQAVEDLVGA